MQASSSVGSQYDQCHKGLGALTNFIRTFSGDKGSDLSIMEFVESIDRAAAFGNWDHQNIIMVLYSKLKGVGLEFFRLSPHIQTATTWTDIRSALVSRFGERESPRDPIRDLQGIKQNREERVIEYAMRVQSIVRKINMNKDMLGISVDDVYIRRLFVDGLSDSIRTHILADKDLTLTQIVEKADWVQGEIERTGGRKAISHVMSVETRPGTHRSQGGMSEDSSGSIESLIRGLGNRIEKLELGLVSHQASKSPSDGDPVGNPCCNMTMSQGKSKRGEQTIEPLVSIGDARRNALVKVIVRGKAVDALVDPGAYISVINEAFVDELGLGRWVKGIDPVKIIGFGCGETEARFQVELWIFFAQGKKRFSHPFVLVDGKTCINYPIILGYDFFRHKRIDLILSQGILGFEGSALASLIESKKS